jgi:hypothetical protein
MLASRWTRLRKAFGRVLEGPSKPRVHSKRTLQVELLEERSLMTAGDSFVNPIGLALTIPAATAKAPPIVLNAVQESGFLSSSSDYSIFRLDDLKAADLVTLDVDAQSHGSGLNSYLRVFRDAKGGGLLPVQVFVNDDFEGSDSRLTFQADGSSTYYVGVSAAGNTTYNPNAAAPPNPATASIQVGATHGLFELTVTRTPAAAVPTANLTSASFNIVADVVSPGDSVQLQYRVENRGAAASGQYQIQFVLSADNQFGVGDTPLSSVAALTSLPALAAGGSRTGTVTVTLPDDTPATYFIGMVIVPVAPGTADNSMRVRGVNWDRVSVVQAISPAANHSLDDAFDLPASGNALTGTTNIVAGTDDFYRVTVANDGRLTAHVTTTSTDTVLSLLCDDGALLVQSAGRSATDTSDFIQQHLAPGEYILRVSARTATAQYRLSTEFTRAADPLENIPLTFRPKATISADFTGDGILDLAYGGEQLVVLPGLGDGSFGRAVVSAAPTSPITALFRADLNHDGIADLVSIDEDLTVNVRLGNGDGSFVEMPGPGSGFQKLDLFAPNMLALADFDQDGNDDLVIGIPEFDGGLTNSRIYFYQGEGDGSFDLAGPTTSDVAGDFLGTLGVGDFDRDGYLDLVSTSGRFLRGQGDGSFEDKGSAGFDNGETNDITVVDFNRDGKLDLVATPNGFLGGITKAADGFVLVNAGNGDGTFGATEKLATAGLPKHASVGDFNGDGRWDLAIDSVDVVSIMLGVATPSTKVADWFAAEVRFSLPITADFGDATFATGDFNRDGRLDVASGNDLPQNASILLGNGDGGLRGSGLTPLDSGTIALAAADFNNDGRADIAGANRNNLDLSVILSRGDGTFQPDERYLAAGGLPSVPVVGDFNGDGRLDVALYERVFGGGPPGFPGKVYIFIGVGNGTLLSTQVTADTNPDPAKREDFFIVVADGFYEGPTDMVAADFNGDGLTDLAVNRQVFLTVPGLHFNLQPTSPPLNRPTAVGDLNGDQIPDLIDSSGVALIGDGKGSFTHYGDLEELVGVKISNADTAEIGDFNGDGFNDVAVRRGNSAFSIFFGNDPDDLGAEPFALAVNYAPPSNGSGTPFGFSGQMGVGDFNGDGRSDLALSVEAGSDHRVAICLGQVNDSVTLVPQMSALPSSPKSLVVADFDGDGRADVGTVSSEAFSTGQVSVLLGRGDGTLFNPTERAEPAPQATPLVVDLNRDGTADVVILNQKGEILYRQGRKGEAGVFDAPIIVNPGSPARDVAVLTDVVLGKTTVRLAALDFDSDRVSIYTRNAAGDFERTAGPTTGLVPTRLASADLNGDGRGDLVIVNTGSGDLSVFLGTANGFATQNLELAGGSGPFEITLANVDGLNGVDIVAVNANSGDVSVFHNQGKGAFGPEMRFRADAGPFDLAATDGELGVRSQARTAAVVVGLFDADLRLDVLAINSDSNTFSLLTGRPGGSFTDPRGFQAGSKPTQVVSGDFNRDGELDVAILDAAASTISVYVGDGQGHFFERFVAPAGNQASGFTARDVTGDGRLDLLVGNDFGDMLVIVGSGDGTFKPFVRTEQNVPLATTDLDGDGLADVIVASQALDQALAQLRDKGSSIIDDPDGATPDGKIEFNQGSGNGLVGPGNLALFDMNDDGWDDIVIANSGSNDVRIHLATGANDLGIANEWDPVAKTFFTGTTPTGITADYLNDDDVLDLLVANRGSNDIVVFFGQVDGTDWTLTPGQRLVVGAGPIRVEVRDEIGDANPDLLVSNGFDGTLSILPGLGNGFFNDAKIAVEVIDLGGPLLQGLTGDFFLTQDGTIRSISFDAGTATVAPVFQSVTRVTSFTVADDGKLYAARANGDITQLIEGDGGQLTATLNFRDAQLTNPSALNFVDGEVYVTSSGQTRVFVFGLADGVPVPDFNGDPGLRDQFADVSPLSQAGLALIATLLTGSEGEGVTDSGDLSFVFGLGVGDGEASLTFLTTLLTGAAGGEDGEPGTDYSGAEEVQFSFNDFIIGLEEALEQLRSQLHGPKSADAPQELFEAIDLTFRGLARTANGLDCLLQELGSEGSKVLEASGSVLKSGLQALGATGVEATGSELASVFSSFWRTVAVAGRSVAQPLLDSLRWANLPGIPVADAEGSAKGAEPVPVSSTMDLLAPDDLTCRQLALLAALTFGMWPMPVQRRAAVKPHSPHAKR